MKFTIKKELQKKLDKLNIYYSKRDYPEILQNRLKDYENKKLKLDNK